MTTKCDIFSYGVILWELVTQTRPWAGDGLLPPANAPFLSSAPSDTWAGLNEFQMIYQVTVHNGRLDIPDDLPPKLKALLTSCWVDQPASRPSAGEIRAAIQALVADLERDGS